jgi:hypothetical protein
MPTAPEARVRDIGEGGRFLPLLLGLIAAAMCALLLTAEVGGAEPASPRRRERQPPAAARWSRVPAPNGGTPPAAATEAARLGLPRFLKAIAPQELAHFNFANPAELEVAELGTPFRQFTIEAQQLLDYDPATPLDRIVVPTPIWYFPIVIKGEMRTLLHVEMMDGTWQAVGIGSSGIAKMWTAAQKARPTTARHANIFVRFYAARADFVMSTQDGDVEMIPLLSAGTPPADLQPRHDPADVIESLRASALRSLAPANSLRQ